MAWRIEFSHAADRELGKLDPQIARRILKVLHDRIAKADDPRAFGEALKGSQLGEFWKYRVGDYRFICSIEDQILRILVLRIGSADDAHDVLARSGRGEWRGSPQAGKRLNVCTGTWYKMA